MLTSRQKKGVIFGIIWSFVAWVPYFTEYLGSVRSYLGIPAALGLNLELALNVGDAFIFSILFGAGIGFLVANLLECPLQRKRGFFGGGFNFVCMENIYYHLLFGFFSGIGR